MGELPVSVIAINLDQDSDRFESLSAEIARQENIAFQRLSAIRGSSIAKVVAGLVPGALGMAAGTLGCFLSHVRAWEVLLESAADSAIILEDDVTIRRNLAECHAIARRSGADVVFLNNRMALPVEADQPPHDLQATIPVTEAILARAALNQIACGGDGYYLTRRAAAFLLDTVRSNGVNGDVDWVILFCALGNGLLPGLAANRTFTRKLRDVSQFYRLPEPALSGAVLKSAAVFHGRIPSSRIQENALGAR